MPIAEELTEPLAAHCATCGSFVGDYSEGRFSFRPTTEPRLQAIRSSPGKVVIVVRCPVCAVPTNIEIKPARLMVRCPVCATAASTEIGPDQE